MNLTSIMSARLSSHEDLLAQAEEWFVILCNNRIADKAYKALQTDDEEQLYNHLNKLGIIFATIGDHTSNHGDIDLYLLFGTNGSFKARDVLRKDQLLSTFIKEIGNPVMYIIEQIKAYTIHEFRSNMH